MSCIIVNMHVSCIIVNSAYVMHHCKQCICHAFIVNSAYVMHTTVNNADVMHLTANITFTPIHCIFLNCALQLACIHCITSIYGLRLSMLSLVWYVPTLFTSKHSSACVRAYSTLVCWFEGCGTVSVLDAVCLCTCLS